MRCSHCLVGLGSLLVVARPTARQGASPLRGTRPSYYYASTQEEAARFTQCAMVEIWLQFHLW